MMKSIGLCQNSRDRVQSAKSWVDFQVRKQQGSDLRPQLLKGGALVSPWEALAHSVIASPWKKNKS